MLMSTLYQKNDKQKIKHDYVTQQKKTKKTATKKSINKKKTTNIK